MENKKPHPWAAFLNARANCIHWMLDNDKTFEEIAHTLSMDSTQVYLISVDCKYPIPDGSGNDTSKMFRKD